MTLTTASTRILRLRALLLSGLVACSGGLGLSDAGPTDSNDCAGDVPLLEVTVPLSSVCDGGSSGTTLGEWRLPVSPRKPELLTAARFRLALGEATAKALAPQSARTFQADFSFPDPQPFGLPFTFQRLDLQVEQGGDQVLSSGSQDWSFSCTNPGRSIYPGQGFQDALSLPCPSAGRPETKGLQLRVRLWGARM